MNYNIKLLLSLGVLSILLSSGNSIYGYNITIVNNLEFTTNVSLFHSTGAPIRSSEISGSQQAIVDVGGWCITMIQVIDKLRDNTNQAVLFHIPSNLNVCGGHTINIIRDNVGDKKGQHKGELKLIIDRAKTLYGKYL